MTDIRVEKIIVKPLAGSRIDHTMKEAIILALMEWRTVEVEFNDTKYEFNPSKIVASLINECAVSKEKD
jgi:hypothetical protein